MQTKRKSSLLSLILTSVLLLFAAGQAIASVTPPSTTPPSGGSGGNYRTESTTQCLWGTCYITVTEFVRTPDGQWHSLGSYTIVVRGTEETISRQ